MSLAVPVLYSFRRCPYAIRARWALLQSGVSVELREVVLRDKPQALLEASPKGTVPVLVLPGGQVIDESLAIMRWALTQNDPESWLGRADTGEQAVLLAANDGPFKQALDAYKYPERHPELSAESHRAQGEAVLVAALEQRLSTRPFIGGSTPSLTDAAIFPFIRQWAAVDAAWFEQSRWIHVRRWLKVWSESEFFGSVMHKFPAWHVEQEPLVFPSQSACWQQPVKASRAAPMALRS